MSFVKVGAPSTALRAGRLEAKARMTNAKQATRFMEPCLSKADYTPYHGWTLRDQPGLPRTLLVFVGVGVLYTIFIARTVFTYKGHLVGTLFDDALISMRYAHNLVSGHGLVWNPGENPPVEGYTNLAWTLVMSAVLLVWSKTIAPIVLSALGAVTLLASGIVVRRILERLDAPPSLQTAGIAIVLTYYPLVFWTLRGMEVGLLAWLLLMSVDIALRPAPADETRAGREIATLSAIAGLGFLTRNDSILVFALVLAAALQTRVVRRHALAAIVPLGLCILFQFVFRYAYYGELMPNTYVLKMTGVSLSVRLSRGLDAFAETLAPLAWLASIAGAAALSDATPRAVKRLLGIGLALSAVQSCYLVWVGGDAWDFDHSNRFVATVAPVLLTGVVAAAPFCMRLGEGRLSAIVFLLLSIVFFDTLFLFPAFDPPSNRMMLGGWVAGAAIAVAAFVVAKGSPTRQRDFCMAGALVATVVITSGYSWVRWVANNGTYVSNDMGVSQFGLLLRDTVPPKTVIAAGWLGAPAYFTGLEAIDIFGKTDKHIARITPTLPFRPGHNKEDLAYSVGTLRPDIVIIGLDRPDVEPLGYVRVREGIYVRRDEATSDWVAAAFPETARP
jgi:hypothetical protein